MTIFLSIIAPHPPSLPGSSRQSSVAEYLLDHRDKPGDDDWDRGGVLNIERLNTEHPSIHILYHHSHCRACPGNPVCTEYVLDHRDKPGDDDWVKGRVLRIELLDLPSIHTTTTSVIAGPVPAIQPGAT